jgi:hypothetical protein
MSKVGLTEAISVLRQELSEAIAAAATEELRFEVGQVNMEFEVTVEREVGANGKIKFWVLEVGTNASSSSVRTHRLVVPLTPVNAAGGPVMTGEQIIPD